MNPTDFRERALLATEPLQPGPASYEWLRDNVARRRRATRVFTAVAAAGCVAVAGVAFAALPGGGERTAPPLAPPSAGLRPVAMDVDGDGRADDVFITDADDPWGVEVRGTRWGTVVLTMDDPAVGTHGRGINGTMHMDSEPGAETLVGVMEGIDSGATQAFLLVVPVDGRPVWLTDQRGDLVRLPDDHTRLDCTTFPDGRRGVVITGDNGRKATYEIVRGVLTPVATPEGALESCYLE
jgi:hypothetical protein